MNKLSFGFKSLKAKVLFVVVMALFAFVVPPLGGLIGLITPISLVLFILGLIDLIRHFRKSS